jgi:hypothetical protein
MGLGSIYKDCTVCKGIGFVESSLAPPVAVVAPVSAPPKIVDLTKPKTPKRGRPNTKPIIDLTIVK